MNDAVNHLTKVIAQIKSDIAIEERLSGGEQTDESRAYHAREIASLQRRLAKRKNMLAAEIAETN